VAGPDGAPLERLMRVTRLGQGVDATGTLDPAAIDRTVAVLADYRAVMDRWGVVRGRLVATSAVRDAANGGDFLAAAREAVGFEAELLSGDEEGRLAYAGATADLAPVEGDDLVLDVGGGSTELVLAGPGGLEAVSLDVGCVRLSERHLHHDPPTAAELAEVTATVDAALDQAVEALPGLSRLAAQRRLVGLAGTVATLVGLERGLATYDRDRVHHAVVGRPAVEGWLATLAGEPAAARAARTTMMEGRQDVIVGGLAVVARVMERFGFEALVASESDILDGLVASQLAG